MQKVTCIRINMHKGKHALQFDNKILTKFWKIGKRKFERKLHPKTKVFLKNFLNIMKLNDIHMIWIFVKLVLCNLRKKFTFQECKLPQNIILPQYTIRLAIALYDASYSDCLVIIQNNSVNFMMR